MAAARCASAAAVRESPRLCVLAARRINVEKRKMSGRERTLITLLVGHTSEMLDKPHPEGHTFRWTCFVRPVGGQKFTDRSFINKVKFTLHNSYTVPVRTIKQPPFEVSETGYGSFPPQIEIHFNYPGAKPIKYTYDMLITLDKHNHTEQEVIFELRDCPPAFVDIAKKYGGRRKRSADEKGSGNEKVKMETLFPPLKISKLDDDRTSRESSKAPKEKKKDKVEKEKEREKTVAEKPKEKERSKEEKEKRKREKEKIKEKEKEKEKKREKTKSPTEPEKKSNLDGVKASSSSSSNSAHGSPRLPVTPNRPVKMAPNKTEERKPTPSTDSSSPSTSYGSLTPPLSSLMSTTEMKRRISALTDEDQIFRVATILLTHPSSSLLPSKACLAFDLDLSTADPSLVTRLHEALAS